MLAADLLNRSAKWKMDNDGIVELAQEIIDAVDEKYHLEAARIVSSRVAHELADSASLLVGGHGE